MESIRWQVYLLKDYSPSEYPFAWVPSKYRTYVSCPGHAILYEGRFESCKITLIEATTEDKTLEEALSKIKEIVSQPMGRSCIEMDAKLDKLSSTFKLSVSIMLDDSLVQRLSILLNEATISIQGVFGTNYRFKISDLELKATNYVEDFEGADSILQMLNRLPDYAHRSIVYSIILEWKELKMAVKRERFSVLDKLLSEKILTDCSVITAEDKEISCHRNILAANSDVIYAMLTSGMEESINNKIPMTDISEKVVNLLLAYLYGRDINTTEMEENIAYELLRTAHKYNISSLQELMAVTLFNKPIGSFSMNTVLDVYFFTLNVEELAELSDKMLV